ncbi:MAG: hypothetical protein QME66_12580 [Candidatus Eisenbacteria bacterium]|nr:hypothetical protein [Candidatus Eisenbacteria bacterium]
MRPTIDDVPLLNELLGRDEVELLRATPILCEQCGGSIPHDGARCPKCRRKSLPGASKPREWLLFLAVVAGAIGAALGLTLLLEAAGLNTGEGLFRISTTIGWIFFGGVALFCLRAALGPTPLPLRLRRRAERTSLRGDEYVASAVADFAVCSLLWTNGTHWDAAYRYLEQLTPKTEWTRCTSLLSKALAIAASYAVLSPKVAPYPSEVAEWVTRVKKVRLAYENPRVLLDRLSSLGGSGENQPASPDSAAFRALKSALQG